MDSTIRNSATDRPRVDGLPAAAAFPEFENVLSIAPETARALDVMAVNVNPIFGMVAKVGQTRGSLTGGP